VVVTLNDYSSTSYTPKLKLPGQDQNILYALDRGTYYLSFKADLFTFCPVLDIEFALAPNTTAPPSCPAGVRYKLNKIHNNARHTFVTLLQITKTLPYISKHKNNLFIMMMQN
jgi:hypothetical protein